MAKLSRGRLEGTHGMESQTVEELDAWADGFERRSRQSSDCDDPNWLRKWADRLRLLAVRKEKARRHKAVCRRDRG